MCDNNNVARPSRAGEANPMYGRTHTQQTKDAISKSQRQRYERMREKIQPLTVDDYLKSENFRNFVNAILREEITILLDQKNGDSFLKRGTKDWDTNMGRT